MNISLTMNYFVTAFTIFLFASRLSAQFIVPIDGKQNVDWFLVNYVDRDTNVGSFLDHRCQQLTYDQHQGSDFVIRDFRQMDSGVKVFAAKSGRVYYTHDGEFDRSTQPDSGGYGNFISIGHGDSLYSIYAHLKKYSQLVKIGDSVEQGQYIGLVGSSGKASDPHLHFEVYHNGVIVDPFGDHCPLVPVAPSLFTKTPFYENEFAIIDEGFVDYVPSLNDLREHPAAETVFSDLDSTIFFWLHGLSFHFGDTLRYEWRKPDGSLWFSYGFRQDTALRFWYTGTYINGPAKNAMDIGTWHINCYRNDSLFKIAPFEITISNSVAITEKTIRSTIQYSNNELIFAPEAELTTRATLELFSISGALIKSFNADNLALTDHQYRIALPLLPSGKYFLRVTDQGKTTTHTFVITK